MAVYAALVLTCDRTARDCAAYDGSACECLQAAAAAALDIETFTQRLCRDRQGLAGTECLDDHQRYCPSLHQGYFLNAIDLETEATVWHSAA